MPEPTQAARDLAEEIFAKIGLDFSGDTVRTFATEQAAPLIDAALDKARQEGRDDIYQAMGRVIHRARITNTVQKGVNPQWGAHDDRRTR